MRQFDKWQEYWNNYLLNKHGKSEIETEDDLYCQVGLTVNKQPMGKTTVDRFISIITEDLSLTNTDILLDLCCGNGLVTFELKDYAAEIYGIDFSQLSIDTAKKLKNADNITYCFGAVIEVLNDFAAHFPGVRPNKFLMNNSLSYFSPADLENILTAIINISSKNFICLFTGVPNDALKWNYYNTDVFKERYLENVASGDLTNDGLGRWWAENEFAPICEKLNLEYFIRNQPPTLSDYRMDIVISSR